MLLLMYTCLFWNAPTAACSWVLLLNFATMSRWMHIRLFCHDICKSLLTYTHLFWHIPAAACSCMIYFILATTPSASTTLYSACLFSCIFVSFIRLFWHAHVSVYTYPQLHVREWYYSVSPQHLAPPPHTILHVSFHVYTSLSYVSFDVHTNIHEKRQAEYSVVEAPLSYVSFDLHTSLLTNTHLSWHVPTSACSCMILLGFATTPSTPTTHYSACLFFIYIPSLLTCTCTRLCAHVPAAACSCMILLIFASTPSTSTTRYSVSLFSCTHVSFIHLFWLLPAAACSWVILLGFATTSSASTTHHSAHAPPRPLTIRSIFWRPNTEWPTLTFSTWSNIYICIMSCIHVIYMSYIYVRFRCCLSRRVIIYIDVMSCIYVIHMSCMYVRARCWMSRRAIIYIYL